MTFSENLPPTASLPTGKSFQLNAQEFSLQTETRIVVKYLKVETTTTTKTVISTQSIHTNSGFHAVDPGFLY